MIKIIKMDNKQNYFIDKNTHEKIEKYDPDIESLALVTRLEDGSRLNVESSQIHQQYGGSIYFDYLEDRYLIDDNYQDILIRAGYVVLNDYDRKQENNKSIGLEIRNLLMQKIKNATYKIDTSDYDEYVTKLPNINEVKIVFEKEGYKFTIFFNTVNNIVNKNQQRKLNQLPFYPFSKDMDKYGTVYISIFCQKMEVGEFGNVKYEIAEKFISDFIRILSKEDDSNDQFHYVPLMVKKRIINSEGL